MEVPKRNFVGELQEVCQEARVSLPQYEDESIGNDFKFSCKLNDYVCHGTGQSKKFAKQLAAKAMLVKIDRGKGLSSTSGENAQISSVSKLIQYCTQEKKGNPLFSDLPKEGDLFCNQCSLNNFSAVGKGFSKKEAKEKAAFEVANHFGVHEYYDNWKKSKEQARANMSGVQELSVFCRKNRFDVPTYEEEEIKENNEVKYKVSCSVGDLKQESGLAHSKKSAKYEVACLMLQTLKSDTPVASPAKEDTKPALKRVLDNSEEEPFLEPKKKVE